MALLAGCVLACAAGPEAIHVERAYEELAQPDPNLALAHAHLRQALDIAPDDPYAQLAAALPPDRRPRP